MSVKKRTQPLSPISFNMNIQHEYSNFFRIKLFLLSWMVRDDEVIESTTTASQKMSVDNTTASEVTAADATSLPEHDFIKKLITGKKKGKTTISYMILMGPTHTLLKQVFIISCQV